MAESTQPSKKKQLSITEYFKIKQAQVKNKLKLRFPPFVKWILAIPLAYLVFMVVYFLVYLRFLPEH